MWKFKTCALPYEKSGFQWLLRREDLSSWDLSGSVTARDGDSVAAHPALSWDASPSLLQTTPFIGPVLCSLWMPIFEFVTSMPSGLCKSLRPCEYTQVKSSGANDFQGSWGYSKLVQIRYTCKPCFWLLTPSKRITGVCLFSGRKSQVREVRTSSGRLQFQNSVLNSRVVPLTFVEV